MKIDRKNPRNNRDQKEENPNDFKIRKLKSKRREKYLKKNQRQHQLINLNWQDMEDFDQAS